MKRNRTPIGASVMVVALLASACGPAPVSTHQARDPASVIEAFNEALTAGDVDAAMALVADDAVMDRGPYGIRSGSADIREALEIETSKELRFEVSNLRVSGDTVTYDWRVTNLSGEVFEGTSEAIVQDGKIKSDK